MRSLDSPQEPLLPLESYITTHREIRHVTHLVFGKGKQFLSQTISVLNGPFLSQEFDNLIMAFQENISIPPNGVRSVTILDNRRVPIDTQISFNCSQPLQPLRLDASAIIERTLYSTSPVQP